MLRANLFFSLQVKLHNIHCSHKNIFYAKPGQQFDNQPVVKNQVLEFSS